MTNIDPEVEYDNLTDVLEFAFLQMTKGLWTACPGIVQEYNNTTKRAKVRPALRLLDTEGNSQSRPTVVNVPVVHPSGGGFVVHMPVRRGDAVMMVFSRRGISRFKETFGETDPDGSFYELKDAMVIPGFGGLEISPASTDGISMQTESGNSHIVVEQNEVIIEGETTVTVNANEMISLNVDPDTGVLDFNGDRITFNGNTIHDTP